MELCSTFLANSWVILFYSSGRFFCVILKECNIYVLHAVEFKLFVIILNVRKSSFTERFFFSWANTVQSWEMHSSEVCGSYLQAFVCMGCAVIMCTFCLPVWSLSGLQAEGRIIVTFAQLWNSCLLVFFNKSFYKWGLENNLKGFGAIFSVVSGKCNGQMYCLLFPHYVRYMIMM